MDQLIKELEASLIREVMASGSIDPVKLGALCSSFKDLTIARFIEELRTGKLHFHGYGGVRGVATNWYVGPELD